MLAIISFELNDLDVFSLHVAVAIENHTLFQNKHRRNDISVNSGGLAKLYTLSGGDMPYCAMYNLTQGRYVAPFVILTLQGLTLELKEGNNGRVHHGTTIQAGVFTIHL